MANCPVKHGIRSRAVQSVVGGLGTASTGAGRGTGRGAAGSRGRSQIGQGTGQGQTSQGSSALGGQARVYHLTR